MRATDENRVVVLDLELTGTDLDGGDRIVSLGLVEVFDQSRFGSEHEWFFNTQGQKNNDEAIRIHGITDAFLEDKPIFAEMADDIAQFIGASKVVHHCWTYQGGPRSVDEAFMAMEFERAGRAPLSHEKWVNMKDWARKIDPDNNSLNNMLDRFGIDRTSRDGQHGALLDARLTAQLFIAYKGMTF